jgi:hypothetical protein
VGSIRQLSLTMISSSEVSVLYSKYTIVTLERTQTCGLPLPTQITGSDLGNFGLRVPPTFHPHATLQLSHTLQRWYRGLREDLPTTCQIVEVQAIHSLQQVHHCRDYCLTWRAFSKPHLKKAQVERSMSCMCRAGGLGANG